MSFRAMSPTVLLIMSIFIVILCQVLHANGHRIEKRLVGGEKARLNEAPFVVQLVRNNKTICSGSIISPDLVVSAAHCTLKGVDWIVYATEDLFRPDQMSNFKMVKVKKILAHPQYRSKDASKWSNDIAILRLQRAILPDAVARPIDLPLSRFETTQCGAKVRVFGFGRVKARHDKSSKGARQKGLQVMETEIQDSCWTDSRSRFIATQMTNKTVCHGDSGGALVRSDGRLIGVTARSSCIRGKRDLFVRVSSHLDFIHKVMSTKQKIGTFYIIQKTKDYQ